jgi:hypothetical protein
MCTASFGFVMANPAGWVFDCENPQAVRPNAAKEA